MVDMDDYYYSAALELEVSKNAIERSLSLEPIDGCCVQISKSASQSCRSSQKYRLFDFQQHPSMGFSIAAGKPVYRNSYGEESYLAGRKPEQRCSPVRTWCYVLGLSGSGTQKTVYVPDEGSFILVSAGLEAKVNRVVYSHRNPANYNTNLRTSDEAGEQHTNRRIAGYVNSHHSGNATSELDTSTVHNKLEPIEKWARGCFASETPCPSRVQP